MKYIDLINAYFNSDEFAQTINELYKKENQNHKNNFLISKKN